jgi:hypothetical protein
LNFIKNEFYNINRDVLLSERKDVISSAKLMETINSNYTIEIINNKKLENEEIKKNEEIKIKNKEEIKKNEEEEIYKVVGLKNYKIIRKKRRLILNLRDVLKQTIFQGKFGYSEDIFNPYYRYMISLLIFKLYSRFTKILGYKNTFFKVLGFKENNINNYTYILFNFIIVKVLLELFHFNYRSLLRVKPKFYYLNKIRYHLSRFKRLTFIN